MGKRIIKNISNEIIRGDNILDPNTLTQFINMYETSNRCLTKFYIKNNLIKNSSNNCINKSLDEIKKLMLIPSVVINFDSILNVYNIESITDLLSFIDNSIKDNLNFKFINRVINSWIRKNYEDLKKFNKILFKIYYSIFKYFYNYLITSKELFYKDIKLFIPYWIENNNTEIFNLNLTDEFKKYLTKKYEQK
jgi:hypothetical protein